MTENEQAIVRNDAMTRQLGLTARIVNLALLAIVLALAITLVVTSTGFTSDTRTLRQINEANTLELRCRSEFTNRQADAAARMAIQQAESQALTALALAAVDRGEPLRHIADDLAANADELRALAVILNDTTRERNDSSETCQQED